MEPFHKNLSDLKYLIPYLGFDNYLVAIDASTRYHLAENPGHKIVENGFNLNSVRNKGKNDEDAEEHQATKEEIIEQSLIHLDDQIIKDLCISIIKLMRYFCSEAEDNKVNSLFDATSGSMNENGREAALFNCLKIPDDNVRLAVVECLLVVPLDEFDFGEISIVTNVISTCTNIGAG